MSLAKKMMGGMLWSAADRFATQIVNFVLGIVLANLLSKEQYGIYSILLIFTALSQVFIQSGFPAALIHKQDRTDKDTGTVFIFNTLISLFLMAVLIASAPFIADFYGDPKLSDYLRVISLVLILNALYTVPATLLRIKLDFKSFTKINLVASILAGSLAIYLAYDGFGVWALVVQAVTRSFLTMALTFIMARWKPIWIFDWTSFRSLFRYGVNLLFSSLLNKLAGNFSSLYIGKTLSTGDLGLYTRGTQFSDFLFTTLNNILSSVFFPGLSTIQDKQEVLREAVRKIIRLASMLTVPAFFGMIVLTEPIILFLLTDKWIEAAPVMQFIGLARLITIVCSINVTLVSVMGRPDLQLRQQYLVVGSRIAILVFTVPFGIYWVAVGELAGTCLHFFINTYFPGKMLKYGAWEQIRDNYIFYLLGAVMVIPVYIIRIMLDDLLLMLVAATLVGALTYFSLLFLFCRTELQFLYDKLRQQF